MSILGCLVWALLLLAPGGHTQTDDPVQRSALVALYKATGGSNWDVFQEQPSVGTDWETGSTYCDQFSRGKPCTSLGRHASSPQSISTLHSTNVRFRGVHYDRAFFNVSTCCSTRGFKADQESKAACRCPSASHCFIKLSTRRILHGVCKC
eukprot:scaffold11597_cov20-Tisochrysis_lutea.AAC.3